MTDSTNEAKRYNGWTNYETWLLKLWMDNDQGSYEHWQESTRQAIEDAKGERSDDDESTTLEQDAAQVLRGVLKDEFEEAWEQIAEPAGIQASFWADMMNATLSEVNWYEIAEHLVEDAKDE